MQTETQAESYERYLFAYGYFSDELIAAYKEKCMARHEGKPKSEVYQNFINWVRQENEIAVFTLYAYADLQVPKTFDIIFQIDNPENYVKEEYLLTQSIFEAWFPSESIDHGHKHLCILKFNGKIPAIMKLLDVELGQSTLNRNGLGFCSSIDFEKIKQRKKEIL